MFVLTTVIVAGLFLFGVHMYGAWMCEFLTSNTISDGVTLVLLLIHDLMAYAAGCKYKSQFEP